MSNKAVMKQDAKPALTPKLRFPEFRDAKGWETTSLVDVLSPVLREMKKPSEAYTGLGLRSHGKGTFLKRLADPDKNSMEYLYEVKCNDLIVNITFAWEGAVAIAQSSDEGALVSHRFPTYTFEKGRTTPKFFKFIILDKLFVYKLGVISPGGAGRNRVLSKSDFLKLSVLLPSPAEQQKIAECLTTLDEVIAAQSQKLDALKTHKKGLMQQLFPREGETLPRLRFPEFQDAPEWVPANLSALSSVGLSNGVFNDPKKVGSGYKLINVSDMYIDTTIIDDRLSLLELSVSDFESNQVEQGDIFFTRSSLVKTGIAVSNIYLGDASDVTFDGHLIRFRANRSKVIPLFAHYLFKSTPIRNQLIARGKTATMTTIGQADVAGVGLHYPNKEEQQRIATCLTNLDDLITAQSARLDALKTHKTGLMQQLFPSPEEAAP
jgi:type I restriction enzyme S subunit